MNDIQSVDPEGGFQVKGILKSPTPTKSKSTSKNDLLTPDRRQSANTAVDETQDQLRPTPMKNVRFDGDVSLEMERRGERSSHNDHRKKGLYSYSPYTLKINDKVMEEEFRSYLRQEIKRHSKFIMLILVTYSLLLFFNYIYRLKDEEDDKIDDGLCLFLINVIPTLTLTILYLLSLKKE